MRRSQQSLISLLVFLAAAPCATETQAEGSASTQFTVTGEAPNVCSMPSPQTTGTASNATFASSAINITQFIDTNNAQVIPSSLSLQYPNTLCNYNATLSIKSQGGGLVSSNAAPVAGDDSTFLQIVPYTVRASWGTVRLELDTTGSSGSSVLAETQTNGAVSGNLTLDFTMAASALPVPQGSYQDTILIKIGTPM